LDIEVNVDGNVVLVVAAWLTAVGGLCLAREVKLDGIGHAGNEEQWVLEFV
jgi:hypothetical protein